MWPWTKRQPQHCFYHEHDKSPAGTLEAADPSEAASDSGFSYAECKPMGCDL